MPHNVYLLLGSNLGNREQHLKFAREKINIEVGKICKQSSIYETEPWGFSDQPSYLNQALNIESDLNPLPLLRLLKKIEKESGRTNQIKYRPRTLDIDILFYNDEIINRKELIIPHPKMHVRKFALIPLNEIAGDLKHPSLRRTIKQLLKQGSDSLNVRKFEG